MCIPDTFFYKGTDGIVRKAALVGVYNEHATFTVVVNRYGDKLSKSIRIVGKLPCDGSIYADAACTIKIL